MSKLKDEVIGKRVRQARLELGFSQEELAVGVGLSRSQIANVESGRTVLSLKDADTICNFLGLELIELTDVTKRELDSLILFRQKEHDHDVLSDEELIDWSDLIIREVLSQEQLYKKGGDVSVYTSRREK
ncbi:helix-turn-helix domain-containing protein [Bacillus sp. DJP31]|uniref:helix-turn-helix domain-containing protein n=1 Tax=Bacillus sp. DJP31 TaxID=3409789 RepID=UPI003BB7DA5E